MADRKLNTILTLLELKGIGPSLVNSHSKTILESCDNNAGIKDILPLITKKEFTPEEIEVAKERAGLIIEICIKSEIDIITFYSKDFPKTLENYKSKFSVLYCLGNFQPSKTVGIIGSRKARDVASTIAERIGSFCEENDFNIVSGIAEGIDTQSISILPNKNNVIGVVPGGLALEEYNTLNKSYLDNARNILIGGGALISQFPPIEKQDQFSVVKYCILQAALSDSLVLVQSSIDGGSRFTIEHFCQQEKTLFVVNAMKYDSAEEEYAANKLILEKKQAGLAEWCKIKPEKVKCNIQIINTKEDYRKLLSTGVIKDNNPTLF